MCKQDQYRKLPLKKERRAIRIVRAAKGPSGYPPRILLPRRSLGPSSTRHIRIGRCDRLIAAGKDRGWQMTPPRMPPLTVASIQKGRLGPTKATYIANLSYSHGA